jgi:hypothetical protein
MRQHTCRSGAATLAPSAWPIPAPSMPNLKVPSTDRGTRASWKKFDHTAVLPPSKTQRVSGGRTSWAMAGTWAGCSGAPVRSPSGLSSLARSFARSSRTLCRQVRRVSACADAPRLRSSSHRPAASRGRRRGPRGPAAGWRRGRPGRGRPAPSGPGPPVPSWGPCPTSRSRRAATRARGSASVSLRTRSTSSTWIIGTACSEVSLMAPRAAQLVVTGASSSSASSRSSVSAPAW